MDEDSSQRSPILLETSITSSLRTLAKTDYRRMKDMRWVTPPLATRIPSSRLGDRKKIDPVLTWNLIDWKPFISGCRSSGLQSKGSEALTPQCSNGTCAVQHGAIRPQPYPGLRKQERWSPETRASRPKPPGCPGCWPPIRRAEARRSRELPSGWKKHSAKAFPLRSFWPRCDP
jgi:hypothetical protein